MDAITQAERDQIVRELTDLWDRAYPESGPPPAAPAAAGLRERYYQRLGEYVDRLPRIPLSACPFTGDLVKRTLDPWGYDGPFWHAGLTAEIEEPRPSPHFLVLLGAIALQREAPAEATDKVLAGPDVPFVVPAILELEGVVAVMSRVRLENGDLAYPIAYYAEDRDTIEPIELHQPWLREDYWFTDDEGNISWSISNDVWDFELEPWLRSGKLRWVDLEAEEPTVRRLAPDEPLETCPWARLDGQRQPQAFGEGAREWLPLPDGEMIYPFEDQPEAPTPEDLEKSAARRDEVFKQTGGLAGLKEQLAKDTSLSPEKRAEWERVIAAIESGGLSRP